MHKSDPGQLQEWKQWLNGWVPRYTPRCSFLKNWIDGLMVEWLTENIPPLQMTIFSIMIFHSLTQISFHTDISTTLCKTIAFILLWFDGSCFKQCLTFFGKAKSEHFVSLNTGWLPICERPSRRQTVILGHQLGDRKGRKGELVCTHTARWYLFWCVKWLCKTCETKLTTLTFLNSLKISEY